MKEVKFGDNYQQKLEIPCYKQAHTYSLIGLLIFNIKRTLKGHRYRKLGVEI